MNRADNEKARQALAGQGIEFVQPEGAELDRWREIADQATAQLEKEGAFSSEMYRTVSKYLTDYRNTLAQQ
jgi:TRAP-type C4-dicarboxylate transport system substrate-binding protein